MLPAACCRGQVLAAVVGRVASRADVEAVAKLAADAGIPAVVMDAADWQSIPAENLVAAFQVSMQLSHSTLKTLQAVRSC